MVTWNIIKSVDGFRVKDYYMDVIVAKGFYLDKRDRASYGYHLYLLEEENVVW